MIRWGAITLLVAVVAIPAAASAQVCRRVCRAGEVRDANRCCVPPGRIRGRGNLRVEADVARGRVGVGGKWRRVTFPATLHRVTAGKHRITIRAGKHTWRGNVRVRAGKTTRLFASVAGREWGPVKNGAKRARAILNQALAAKGGAKLVRKLTSVRYVSGTAATYILTFVNPMSLSWTAISRVSGASRPTMRGVTPGYVTSVRYVHGRRKQTSRPATNADRAELWQFPDVVLSRHLDSRTRVALLPAATFAGLPVDVVQIAHADGSARTRLYIERARHMLRGVQPINADGSFAPAIELTDYRRVKGLAVAFGWRYRGVRVRWQNVEVAIASGNKPGIPVAGKGRVGGTVVRIETEAWAGRRPYVAQLNSDGIEDFFGQCFVNVGLQRPGKPAAQSRHSYICGVDGRTFTRLFRIGPLPPGARLASLGRGRLAAWTVDGELRVYDVPRKRELWRTRLGRRVHTTCVGKKQQALWFGPARGRGVIADVGHKTLGRRQARPSWCRSRWYRCPAGRVAVCLSHKKLRSLPVRPGYHLRYVLVGRRVRVGVGYTTKDGRQAVAMAWNRAGKLLWSRRILAAANRRNEPRHVDLVGGRLVIAYTAGKSAYVTALSARTGKRLWRTKLFATSASWLQVGRRRLYVVGFNRGVSAHSLRTGKLLGRFYRKITSATAPVQ